MRRRFLIILAATLGALLAPSGAHAATLSFSGDVLTYTAASGEENNLTTSIAATGFCTVRTDPCLSVSESSGVVITSFPSGDCSATESASVVECRVPTAMVVVLGDRDDTLFDWSGPSTVDGGTGNDGLDGNAGSDQVSGGAGNDALRGESGDDTLDGGDGDDSLEGFGLNSGDTENDTTGRDVYVGGAGADLVDYTARTDPLTLDLDGAADDGGAGEGDRIGADVERLYAGSGNDVLTGNAAVNWLYGYGGDDLLTAGGSDDVLKGGDNADRLFGDDGGDDLDGGPGDDVLDGGPGVDIFDGDGGFSGADTFFARDGLQETINCGAGTDRAQVDLNDQTLFSGQAGCESIDRAAADTPSGGGGGGGDGPQGERTAPRVTRLVAVPGRRLTLTVRFHLSERATVNLRLQRRVGRRWRTLPGSVRRQARAGANTIRVRDRLVGVRRLRPGTHRVVLNARDAAGNRSRWSAGRCDCAGEPRAPGGAG